MTLSDFKNIALAVLAAIGSFLADALGGWDAAFALLCAMMAADYVTGLAVAAIWHKSTKTESGTVSSLAGFKGLVKKAAILLIVCIGNMADRAMGCDLARMMCILFFIGNEGLSLCENIGLMGVPLPNFLKNMFEELRDKGDRGDDDDGK